MNKYKIDANNRDYNPFAVFVERKTILGARWEKLVEFSDITHAQAYLDKVKGLPIY